MAPVPVVKLIIGSSLVFTFLKAHGHSAGKHQAEDDLNELVTKLKEQARTKSVRAILPSGGTRAVEDTFGLAEDLKAKYMRKLGLDPDGRFKGIFEDADGTAQKDTENHGEDPLEQQLHPYDGDVRARYGDADYLRVFHGRRPAPGDRNARGSAEPDHREEHLGGARRADDRNAREAAGPDHREEASLGRPSCRRSKCTWSSRARPSSLGHTPCRRSRCPRSSSARPARVSSLERPSCNNALGAAEPDHQNVHLRGTRRADERKQTVEMPVEPQSPISKKIISEAPVAQTMPVDISRVSVVPLTVVYMHCYCTGTLCRLPPVSKSCICHRRWLNGHWNVVRPALLVLYPRTAAPIEGHALE
ncbi:unnamed protein product [Prorocentrum cordatum]|uniref:phosphoglycerate kinase n=1 Tax=Prorocentrum cordatum TaxID=2364126 RepID=A0ABN9RFR0_9DINO|nr:unnamed protein product [Polarella glacialis]